MGRSGSDYPTPDQTFSLRVQNGIDRTSDARIGDPASWYATINLFPFAPNQLTKVPGSAVYLNGRVDPTNTGNPATGATNITLLAAGASAPIALLSQGMTDLATLDNYMNTTRPTLAVKPANYATGISPDVATKGIRTGLRTINPISLAAGAVTVAAGSRSNPSYVPRSADLPQTGAGGPGSGIPPTLNLAPPRVAGLHRLYVGDNTAWTVGAFNMGAGHADRVFYIAETSAGNKARIMYTETSFGSWGISSSGADFYFLPARSKYVGTNNTGLPGYDFWALGTNQVDQPFCIMRATDLVGATAAPDANGVVPDLFCVQLAVCPSNISDIYAPTTKRMVGVRALTMYAGSVIYGGYRMRDMDATTGSADEENYDNYVAFADVGTPTLIAQTKGIVSNIRIGDTNGEPVTAVDISTVDTDVVGIKAQLVAFTEKRVVVFDGLPPQTDNPLGVNFSSTVMPTTGTNAPRTVVRTPYGLIFMGCDGIVYMLRGRDGVIPIGRKVEPLLRGMSSDIQRQCSAYYDDRGFYKLSFPQTRTSSQGSYGKGTEMSSLYGSLAGVQRGNNIPDEQIWCDLRNLNFRAPDAGAKWSGPHTGTKYSCFAKANLGNDVNKVLAGSAVDGSIYELNRYDLLTHPVPENPANTSYIEAIGITSLMDFGDIHRDKNILAVSIGVATDTPTTLETRLLVNGDGTQPQVEVDWSTAVAPPADLLSSTFVLGTSQPMPSDALDTVTLRPPNRARGKAFRVIFREVPTNGAHIVISDINLRWLLTRRRS